MKKLFFAIVLFLGPLSMWAQNEYLCVEYFNIEYSNTCCCEKVEQKKFRVYPNPTIDFVIVEGSDYVEVFNLSGQNLGKYSAQRVDLSNLPSGLYFIKMQSGEVEKVVKINYY